MKSKFKMFFNRIFSSKTLSKSILSLTISIMLLSVTTFAWIVMGKPSFGGIGGNVIDNPSGVSVGFDTGSGGGSSVILDNIIPDQRKPIIVTIKKPAGQQISFSILMKESTALDKDDEPINQVFDYFFIEHEIESTIETPIYLKSFSDIIDKENGCFVLNGIVEAESIEKVFKFNLFFGNAGNEDVDLNIYQGIKVEIGQLFVKIN